MMRKGKKILIGILLCLPFASWGACRLISKIQFEINCRGHLKRAGDANTIQLAKRELESALSYLEKNNMTSGYTSVLYKGPNEDVGFWHENISSAHHELEILSVDISQLEKTYVLMKLRETLLDQGKSGTNVTTPPGISIFPHNIAFAVWGCLGGFLAFIGILIMNTDFR